MPDQIKEKDALLSNENLVLRTAFDASSDGLWICDADANVLRINKASERMNNIEAKDMIGRNMREIIDNGLIDRSVTLDVLKTKTPVSILQKLKDGRKLMLTGIPVFDSESRLIYIVATERDITEISNLYSTLKKEQDIKDKYKQKILEMQLEEIESRKIIAKSRCFANVIQQAFQIASVDSTVLITGESGVGKGLIAEIIHKYSSRIKFPIIRINCGTIPTSLIESELFGYEEGAFTGANKKGKPGYFELAHKGIIFLDEIGDLPLTSQVKLLRFLDDGRLIRLGGTTIRKIDVRIITATNVNLEDMVIDGRFRKDLYYRINVIPIHVPPLRERKECILPLIDYYIEHFRKKLRIEKPINISIRALDALQAYEYPGNVRELMNICERLVAISKSGLIDLKDLPLEVTNSIESQIASFCAVDEKTTLQKALEKVERFILERTIEKHGTQEEAAKILGINQSTVARKLKKYRLNH